jgi:hypothetical protein
LRSRNAEMTATHHDRGLTMPSHRQERSDLSPSGGGWIQLPTHRFKQIPRLPHDSAGLPYFRSS